MAIVLNRVDLVYLDDVFRSKDFLGIEDFKNSEWFKYAELLEQYTDSRNMRIIHIKSVSDYKYTPNQMNNNKYAVIQEMIASFDDDATLIFTNDNTLF